MKIRVGQLWEYVSPDDLWTPKGTIFMIHNIHGTSPTLVSLYNMTKKEITNEEYFVGHFRNSQIWRYIPELCMQYQALVKRLRWDKDGT